MNILLLISLSTILIYLGYIVIRYGIQYSISETYYTIGEKWWFTLILFAWIFPLMMVGLTIRDSPFIFFGGTSILFVATAPSFKIEKSLERKVHLIGSYLGVGFTILSIIFDFDKWYIGIPFILYIILSMTNIIKIKNKIWWIEILTYLLMLLIILNDRYL